MSSLYVFVDESGNLDFSRNGTTHYVLAAVTALNPIVSSQSLQQLKYDLLRDGNGGDSHQNFHASEDSQIIRNKVFESLNKLSNIKVNYIIADKRKTHPDYQGTNFYSLLGSSLLNYFLTKYTSTDYDKIIIIFDQALTKKDQSSFLKEVKPLLKELGKPYAIYFHRTMSDFNGQIADYFAWAKYVELERKEMRPIESVKDIPKKVFDIFANEETFFY